MVEPRTVAICVLCWVGSIAASAAQTAIAPQPLPARIVANGAPLFQAPDSIDWDERLRTLRRWVADFNSWKEWNEEWFGRTEPGWFGPRSRRLKPEPPPWLFDVCGDFVEADSVFGEACELVAAWDDDNATARLRRQETTARAQKENPTKTRWWEHVHFDLLWPTGQLGSGAFGVVGMHATTGITDRLQIFIAPGAILMNLPTGNGSREWKPATDFGFSYRLVNFYFPGSDRLASLHINIAKAWLFALPGANVSIDLLGFSLTFGKSRAAISP